MKELTLKDRQLLDLVFWFFIISFIGVTIMFLTRGMINYAPYSFICFIISLFLMIRNNTKGLKMQKEQEGKEKVGEK